MKGDKDPYINSKERESPEHMKKRCEKFLRWINRRAEENIAVVSHISLYYILCIHFVPFNSESLQWIFDIVI